MLLCFHKDLARRGSFHGCVGIGVFPPSVLRICVDGAAGAGAGSLGLVNLPFERQRNFKSITGIRMVPDTHFAMY